MPDRRNTDPRAARTRPCYGEDVPDEAEIRELLAGARAARKKPSRPLWIAALVVSVVCVVALAWGLMRSWDEPPSQATIQPTARETGSGFGSGLLVGLGAGIAIGSVLALRRRQP